VSADERRGTCTHGEQPVCRSDRGARLAGAVLADGPRVFTEQVCRRGDAAAGEPRREPASAGEQRALRPRARGKAGASWV